MFDFLRRMIVPIMMIALVGFLATIIFQWGAGMSSRKKYETSNLAAVINGEEISWTDFQRVYDNLVKAEQQKSDEEISDAKQNELYDNAWSQIQYERLLGQEIAKHNITVSDDELYDFLKYSPPQVFMQSPTFQTNGQFDYQKYINALADPNYASVWASYDSYFRNEIKKMKLQEMIIQAAHVTENEVKDYFVALNEKIQVGMINVGYGPFSRLGLTFTDDQYQEYYNTHKDEYTLKERAVINLVSIDKKPSQADWANGQTQILLIADSLSAGADFAEIAKIYSQDNSAAAGGDLGWFPKGQMVPEFDKMVFSMKKGDISPPVKTQFGWHIIKNFGFKDETEGGKTVKKVKASHILIKVVPSQETLDIANRKLSKFRTDALDLGFEEAAAKNNLTPNKTVPFERGANIQFLGRDKSASDFAFENEVDAISQVLENSTKQFVIQLIEKLPAGQAPYDVCERKVKLDVRKEKIQSLCSDTATAIWADIQNGVSFKKAAKKHNIKYEETKEFARGGYVKGLSNSPKAQGAAFALENIGDMSGPIDYNQGTIIFKLLKKTTVDLNQFTTQKDSLTNVILVNKQKELFNNWYENLIKNSEIVNNIQSLRASSRQY